MKFLFIDESDKQKKENKYFFALVGLMINNDNLFLVEQNLRILKEKYKLSNFKELRNKKSKDDKLRCTKEVSLLLQQNNVKVISAVLGCIALKSTRDISNSYFDAITFLLERYFIHLKKENKNGIIIHDAIEKSAASNLRNRLHNFILKEEMTMYGRSKGLFKDKIYPSLFFSDDNHCELLQITDLIGTSLNSSLWQNFSKLSIFDVESLPENNVYLKEYWSLFVKNPLNNQINGWGIKGWM